MDKTDEHHMRYILIILCLLPLALAGQRAHRNLRKGDKAYEENKFEEARKLYEGSLEAENSAKGNYNLGNSLYEQGDYEEAAKRYEEAAGLAEDVNVRNSAYRNLGDAYYQQKDYEKSVEAYKKSLRINPEDLETKYNLSKALRRVQQQQQQQNNQDQDNQDQNEDQEQQDQQQSGQGEEPQDQQGQQNGDSENQQQDQQGEGEEKDSQQQPPNGQSSKANPRNAPKMSREEAERQLGIAADAEKQTMSRLQQANMSGCNSKEEW